jgi:hypothetical protein
MFLCAPSRCNWACRFWRVIYRVITNFVRYILIKCNKCLVIRLHKEHESNSSFVLILTLVHFCTPYLLIWVLAVFVSFFYTFVFTLTGLWM